MIFQKFLSLFFMDVVDDIIFSWIFKSTNAATANAANTNMDLKKN